VQQTAGSMASQETADPFLPGRPGRSTSRSAGGKPPDLTVRFFVERNSARLGAPFGQVPVDGSAIRVGGRRGLSWHPHVSVRLRRRCSRGRGAACGWRNWHAHRIPATENPVACPAGIRPVPPRTDQFRHSGRHPGHASGPADPRRRVARRPTAAWPGRRRHTRLSRPLGGLECGHSRSPGYGPRERPISPVRGVRQTRQRSGVQPTAALQPQPSCDGGDSAPRSRSPHTRVPRSRAVDTNPCALRPRSPRRTRPGLA